jgi:hypothetical protein
MRMKGLDADAAVLRVVNEDIRAALDAHALEEEGSRYADLADQFERTLAGDGDGAARGGDGSDVLGRDADTDGASVEELRRAGRGGLDSVARDERDAAGLADPLAVDPRAAQALDDPDGAAARAIADSLEHDVRAELDAAPTRYEYATHFEGAEADANRLAVDALNGEISQREALEAVSALVRAGSLSEGVARINLDRLNEILEGDIQDALKAGASASLDAGARVDPSTATRQSQQAALKASSPLQAKADQDSTIGLGLFDAADQPSFRLDEASDDRAIADILDEIDADEAAIKAARACL